MGMLRYCQHGGDEGALGHDPGVAAVLVAEHGAVGGHGMPASTTATENMSPAARMRERPPR